MWKRGQKNSKIQRGWIIPRKQLLPDTTGLVHIGTHGDSDRMHKTCASSNQTKSQHGEGDVDTKSAPYHEGVFN